MSMLLSPEGDYLDTVGHEGEDNCPLAAAGNKRLALLAASVGTDRTCVKETAAIAWNAREICLVVCSGQRKALVTGSA